MNSFVKKIGVSEIRKSAGHFSVSFTQRNSAAYLAGVKLALNRERSFRSTVAIRFGLSAVRLLDNAVNVERPQDGDAAVISKNNHAITPRRHMGVIYRRH